MVQVAVLGYGTIGSGVVEVLETNKNSIAKRAGKEIVVKYVLDLRDFPGSPIEDRLVHDYTTILNDMDVDVIVETMGGTNPAYTFVKQALEAGKSVCTSNKELVAKYGPELLQIAKEKQVNFFFEASVGGGIPIIRPLNHCLTGDEIVEITGILNGTTNYMLTKMAKEGSSFDAVLKEAQDLGYAERNPSADVDGFDACRKIAILSSLAFGQNVNFEDIYTEGITKITDLDFMYAKKMGTSIKLFGTSRVENGAYFASVSPVMISAEHPLFSVDGVLNGVLVRGNMVGDVMFFGSGAGKLPTASAVVADVVEAVRHLHDTVETIWDAKTLELAPMEEATNQFFVRVKNTEADKVAEIFGEVDKITVEQLPDEFAFVTKQMTEAQFADAAGALDGMLSRIRVSL
jgi:homoserine dehydrogenase